MSEPHAISYRTKDKPLKKKKPQPLLKTVKRIAL